MSKIISTIIVFITAIFAFGCPMQVQPAAMVPAQPGMYAGAGPAYMPGMTPPHMAPMPYGMMGMPSCGYSHPDAMTIVLNNNSPNDSRVYAIAQGSHHQLHPCDRAKVTLVPAEFRNGDLSPQFLIPPETSVRYIAVESGDLDLTVNVFMWFPPMAPRHVGYRDLTHHTPWSGWPKSQFDVHGFWKPFKNVAYVPGSMDLFDELPAVGGLFFHAQKPVPSTRLW